MNYASRSHVTLLLILLVVSFSIMGCTHMITTQYVASHPSIQAAMKDMTKAQAIEVVHRALVRSLYVWDSSGHEAKSVEVDSLSAYYKDSYSHEIGPRIPRGGGWYDVLVQRDYMEIKLNFIDVYSIKYIWILEDPGTIEFFGVNSDLLWFGAFFVWKDDADELIGALLTLSPNVRCVCEEGLHVWVDKCVVNSMSECTP